MTINKRAAPQHKEQYIFLYYKYSPYCTYVRAHSRCCVNRTQSDKGCEKFVDEYKTEDAEFVTYNPISDEDMASLEKKYDVILEYSSYKDISVDSGDLKGTTLRVFGMPEKLNL